MKKIYLCPATEVYKFCFRDGILLDPSGTGDKVDPVNWDSNPGVIDPGETIDDEDNSRDNNRGSVWDNIW